MQPTVRTPAALTARPCVTPCDPPPPVCHVSAACLCGRGDLFLRENKQFADPHVKCVCVYVTVSTKNPWGESACFPSLQILHAMMRAQTEWERGVISGQRPSIAQSLHPRGLGEFVALFPRLTNYKWDLQHIQVGQSSGVWICLVVCLQGRMDLLRVPGKPIQISVVFYLRNSFDFHCIGVKR